MPADLCVCDNRVSSDGGFSGGAGQNHFAKESVFSEGSHNAILKNTIRRGTNHHYLLRASEGQTMILHLAAKQSGLTVYKPNGGEAIEDADGVNDWTGTLPESGEYTIEVATDAKAAPYTLEVTIR